jgi:F0F1-type ATP synthase membrane subunit a
MCVGTMQPAMHKIVEPLADLDGQILGELRGRFFLLVLTIFIYMITCSDLELTAICLLSVHVLWFDRP